MRTIDIYFTRSSKKIAFFSWLIRVLWQTEYSHTAIGFHSNKYDKDLIYHASGVGLNFSSMSVFNSQHTLVYKKTLEVSDVVYDSIISKAIDLSGTKYGILQSLGVGLAYVKVRLGIGKSNPFKDGRSKWICSEWVAEVLSMIYPDYNPNLETISPKDVYEYVISLPGV